MRVNRAAHEIKILNQLISIQKCFFIFDKISRENLNLSFDRAPVVSSSSDTRRFTTH